MGDGPRLVVAVDVIVGPHIIPSMIYFGANPCLVDSFVSENTVVDIPPASVFTVACGNDLG